MLKSTFVVAAALSILGFEASAQVGTGVFQPPPVRSAGARQGVQRRDTAQAVRVQPGRVTNAVPVAVKLVPAVIMSDGTIMADFGFGLEPVRRACQTVQTGGRVIIGNGQVISQRQPIIQPAPNEPTASQQMSSASQRPVSRAAQGSCFTRDSMGRVFITQ